MPSAPLPILLEFLALAILVLISFIPIPSPLKYSRFSSTRCLLPAQRKHLLIILSIGVLAFSINALITVFLGIPQPGVHDEFSYLLAADTFAHGRLTNPPHPLWKYFESFHVIQQPTYASKYPPAQGLILALGQLFFGHPIVGVWLGVGLACAATSWMLAGWFPLRWAWMGGLIAVVRIVFSGPAFLGDWENMAYWSQSYWGGAIIVLGGSLVFGAIPRIIKEQKVCDALWLAIGLAILANSRPFESLVACLPAMLFLVFGLSRSKGNSWSRLSRRVLLPAALVLLPTISWMAYYNFRVTGDPFRLPYQLYEAQYGVAPVFLWQPLKAVPHYNHLILSNFYTSWGSEWYLMQQSFLGWLRVSLWKISSLWMFYIGVLFSPFLLSLPWIWRRFRVKFALGVWGVLTLALLVETWTFPHYAAPAAPLAFLLQVEALRHTRLLRWRGHPWGKRMTRAVLPIFVVLAVGSFALANQGKQPGWQRQRAQMQNFFEQGQGRYLVIVRYGPHHPPNQEWVYNRANIDNAKVVWAREMNRQGDEELLAYFKDRSTRLLEVD
jgi:hypothetical protein